MEKNTINILHCREKTTRQKYAQIAGWKKLLMIIKKQSGADNDAWNITKIVEEKDLTAGECYLLIYDNRYCSD